MQSTIVMSLVEDTDCEISVAKEIETIAFVINKIYGKDTVAYIDMKSWAYNGISEVCRAEYNKIKGVYEARIRAINAERQRKATEFCMQLLNAMNRRVGL